LGRKRRDTAMVFIIAGIQLTITPVIPATDEKVIERTVKERRLDQIIESNRHRALKNYFWYGTGKIY